MIDREEFTTSLVRSQLDGAVSADVQDSIKAGLVRTQLDGAVSADVQDSIKAGLLRTQQDGASGYGNIAITNGRMQHQEPVTSPLAGCNQMSPTVYDPTLAYDPTMAYDNNATYDDTLSYDPSIHYDPNMSLADAEEEDRDAVYQWPVSVAVSPVSPMDTSPVTEPQHAYTTPVTPPGVAAVCTICTHHCRAVHHVAAVQSTLLLLSFELRAAVLSS